MQALSEATRSEYFLSGYEVTVTDLMIAQKLSLHQGPWWELFESDRTDHAKNIGEDNSGNSSSTERCICFF